MESPASVRIDKWLWAVRLYKTRTVAAEACNAGKVRIQDHTIKPSRLVRVGEVLTAVTGDIKRTVKVLALVEKRVGPKLVSDFLEDQTPATEYEKPRDPNFAPFVFRAKGTGRPTKKDRRKLDGLHE